MTTAKSAAPRHGNKAMLSITVDTDQVENIDQIATRRRTNRSAIIREAIDLYLAKQRESEQAVA